MWIVDKRMQTVRTLGPDELALVTSFVEHTNRGQDVERANALLRGIRTDGYWLACDCNMPAPVMNVALLDSGRLVIRNNPDGHSHKEICPFAKDDSAGENQQKQSGHNIGRIGLDGHIALHVEFSGGSKGDVRQISKNGAISSSPKKKVLSVLLTLMEQAGLTRYDPTNGPSLTEQFAALRQAADRMTLHPGIPLGRYFDSRLNNQRLVAMSKRLREDIDFGSSRKVGLLVDIIDSIHGREITVSGGDSLHFFGRVERAAPVTSPSLALATVTSQQQGLRFFELGQVASVPVASKRILFPLHSGEQRESILDLFSLLEWLSKKGVNVIAARHPFAVGRDHLIELRHRNKMLTLDLTEGLGGQAIESIEQPNIIALSQYRDISAMKRHIAGAFMELVND